MLKRTTKPARRLSPSTPEWKPHPYQLKAVEWLVTNYSAALFLDPGLGKTSVTLAAAKVLLELGTLSGVLVVAPLRPAHSTWPDELAGWRNFKDMDAVVLHGKDFSRLCREKHQVYITNYESIPKLFMRERKGKVWKYGLTEDGKALMRNVNGLVWDELSKMKHVDTMRFKLVKPHLKKFLVKWGLTGSPAANGLRGLFGQCFAVDEGRSLGPYKTHFEAQYFYALDEFRRNLALLPGADELIYDRLAPLALRMDARDHLKLPKFMPHLLKFDLPPAVAEQYTDMERELLVILVSPPGATLASGVVTAATRAAARNKLRQICSGALYLPTVDPITGEPLPGLKAKRGTSAPCAVLHDTKLDMLEELIEELQGHQLLVGYEFRSDLERLLKRFPNTPYIGGGVSAKVGREVEAAWNAGEIPLLFGHPASMGHGLNLQKGHAHHVCWFTETWDFELYDQFVRRLMRQGNAAELLHCYHLVAKGTVEEDVYHVVRGKDRTQQKLLKALKARQAALT